MKAVLLDRDGVINSLVYHEDAGVIDAPFTTSQFKLLPRVPEAIRLLNDMGLKTAIVSNQPGIAKGHLRPGTLKIFENMMLSSMAESIKSITVFITRKQKPRSSDSPVGVVSRRLDCLNKRHGTCTQALPSAT
jgi:histidinol phosphatase-like enzyme